MAKENRASSSPWLFCGFFRLGFLRVWMCPNQRNRKKPEVSTCPDGKTIFHFVETWSNYRKCKNPTAGASGNFFLFPPTHHSQRITGQRSGRWWKLIWAIHILVREEQPERTAIPGYKHYNCISHRPYAFGHKSRQRTGDTTSSVLKQKSSCGKFSEWLKFHNYYY